MRDNGTISPSPPPPPPGHPQAVQDALPDAYVTIYLALLELYKSGGIYVDLTTFFVRPLPAHLDGFVAGGEGPGSDGGLGDCSRPSPGNRRHRPFVMQVCVYVCLCV